MPHKSSEDHKNTRHYIPIISHEYRSPIKERLRNLESRFIHEGLVVFEDFTDLRYVRSLFSFLEFECLLEINDQIFPRFILEFHSQYQINYTDEGQMLIEFVIQNQFFSYTLEEFAQILDIPSEGACVFTDKWSLYELAYGVPRDGPYQTNPPSPDDIISYVQNDRESQVTHTRHRQKINVQDYQILTREIVSTLKPLEVSGGESPELVNESYVLYDRVMNPLTTQQEQKTRKDCGTRRGHHSTSSSSAFDQPSFSHLNDDDDDENDEGTSRASTHSPIRFVNSLTNEVILITPYCLLSSSSSSNSPTMDSTQASSSNPSKKIKLTIILPKQLFVNISSDEDVTTTSSPITTSSSPPPNTPSKTPSTKDTSSTFGTTSSSFE
ncbi:hypothetical protein Tco_1167345 [Tanacetum coccineum]